MLVRQECEPAPLLKALVFWQHRQAELLQQLALNCPPEAEGAVARHQGQSLRSRDPLGYMLAMLAIRA